VNVYKTADEGAQASSQVELPAVLSAPIRQDIVHFVHTHMAKNARQAYAVSKDAGHQTSAESWGTGRAVSRIPRVCGSGTHRSGQGAFGNMCRGGRMFAPTKTWRKWHRKINVNQRRYAVSSALAASAVPGLVMARGHRIEDVYEVPCVVEADGVSKTKQAIALLEGVGAGSDLDNVKASRAMRSGKGKARNRRFQQRRGPLVVYGDEGKSIEQAFRLLPGVELCHVSRLNLLQLAPGGHMGRFCVWTKSAFEQLDGLWGGNGKTSAKTHNGRTYRLPASAMANADLAKVINSAGIQGHKDVRSKSEANHRVTAKRGNALRNKALRMKLDPFTDARRAATSKAQAEAAAANRSKKRDAKRRGASLAFLDRLQSSEWKGEEVAKTYVATYGKPQV